MAGGDEPPYLAVGTEVSAKYRGAFCEARVKKVQRSVKCKVLLKENQTNVMVTDEDIKGTLKIGVVVEVKRPDTGAFTEGTISKLTDQSLYTVIFDDADEKTLRRTQLCLKGEKHFLEGETLDQLPLTHPEHFGTPVMHGGKKGSKRRRSAPTGSDSESDESSESVPPKKRMYKGRLQDMIGRVYLMETDKRKSLWTPVLIVNPNASDIDLPTRDHLLVRSFKDSRFYTVAKKELKEFTRDIAIKNEEKLIKLAMDKALSFFDARDLPSNWDKIELLGSDSEDEGESDVSRASDVSSDDEPSEEKDRFVAQLYKFMDDRGTPINKAPVISSRDLNLYKLFKIVHNLGGYNKVTNQIKWRLVYSKMNLPPSTNSSNQIKSAYKKYLHAFEDFYRKLGNTMGTMSRPMRSRHNSGPGRSILSFRERDKDVMKSPKSPRDVKKSGKSSDDEKAETADKAKPSEKVKADDKKVAPTKEEKTSLGGLEIDTDSPRKSRSQTEKKAKESAKIRDEKEAVIEELLSPSKKREEAKKNKEDGKSKNVKEDDKKSVKAEAESHVVKEEKDEIKQPKKRGRKKSLRDEDIKAIEEEMNKRETKPKVKKEDKTIDKKEEDTKQTKEDKKALKKEEKKSVNKEEKNPPKEDKKTAANKEGKKLKEENKPTKDEKKPASKDGKKTSNKEDGKVKDEKKKEDKKNDGMEKKDTREKRRRDRDAPVDADDGASDAEDGSTGDKELDQQLDLSDGDCLTGTKLKVKYGRGRNQKIYDAKVVEAEKEAGSMHFLVHYAGWNTRYDEWIKKDRIVSVAADDSLRIKQKNRTQSPKPGSGTTQKKRERSKTAPVPITAANSESPSQSQPRPVERPQTANRKSPIGGAMVSNRSRPTRSTSLEMPLIGGLMPKRRNRRSSGITESSDQQSHLSDSDDEEDDNDESSLADSENVAADDMEPEKQESKPSQQLTRPEEATPITTSTTTATTTSRADTEPANAASKVTEEKKSSVSSEGQPRMKSTTESAKSEQVVETDLKKDTAPVVPDTKPAVLKEITVPSESIAEKTDDMQMQTEKSIEENSKTSDANESAASTEQKTASVVREVKNEVPPQPAIVPEPALPEASKPADVISEMQTKESPPQVEHVDKKETKTPKSKKKEGGKEKKRRTSTDVKTSTKDSISAGVTDAKLEIKDTPEVAQKNVALQSEAVSKLVATETPVTGAQEEPEVSTKKEKKKEAVVVPTNEKKEPSATSVLPDEPPKKKSKLDKAEKQKLKSEKAAAAAAALKSEGQNEACDKDDGQKKKIKKKVKKKKEKFNEEGKEAGKEKDKETKKVKDEYDFDDDSLCDLSEMRTLRTERDRLKEARKARETRKSESDKQPVVPANTPLESPAAVARLPSPAAPAIEPQAETDKAVPTSSSECVSDSVPVLERVQPVVPFMESQQQQPLGASSSALMANTPPDTPEHSPPHALPPPDLSPSHEGSSIKSEAELPLEVENVLHTENSNNAPQSGGDSPNTCDTSILSSGSSGGSSGNQPGSESSGEAAPATTKRKSEANDAPQPKRRKRSKKSTSTAIVDKARSRQQSGKPGASDSEEASNHGDQVLTSQTSGVNAGGASPSKRVGDANHNTGSSTPTPRSPRPSKYNFNLEEGKYLEGEKRIAFLTSKIGEIRKIYMQLKAEVACIDRRRKRARRKDREGRASQVSNQVEVECA